MLIREYQAQTDLNGLYRCVSALQDFERELRPDMPAGADICEAYVAQIMEKCARYAGTILVGADADAITGYVTIYTRMISDALEDGDDEYADIGDLLVLQHYRGQGYGRALMQAAEQRARQSGAKMLRIGVLSANRPAVTLYESLQFQPWAIRMEKPV